MGFRSASRLERKLVIRDRGAMLTAVALALTLLIAFLSGWRADQAETAALQSAAERVQQEWAAQPPKNPHSAAHYGILVYRPRAPLQAIEPGVLPYQGAVTFLEAHKRNAPMLSPASVRAAESRYGGTRFSPMLQIAGGFLALVLGFLIGSREARRGMAALLKGAGVRGAPAVAAKVAITGALVLAAAAPSLIVAAFQIEGGDAMARYSILAGASLLHLFVLAAIGVAAGQLLGSARFGLTAVAVTWGLSVLIIPRIVDVAAEQLVPLTQAQLAQTIKADFAKGPDGHGDSAANAAFERQILREYGVETVEELPINFDALLMQADEEYRGGVYDRRLAEAEALRERQDAIRKVSWVFGPTPAMLDLSVRIAGADADTQRRFDESAEVFRRDLVGRLNRHMAENSKSGDWEWTPEDGYYASFKAFRPPAPTLQEDWRVLVPAGFGLLVWLLIAVCALVLAGRQFDKRAFSA
jgi:ABC-2 type transport system permease protein